MANCICTICGGKFWAGNTKAQKCRTCKNGTTKGLILSEPKKQKKTATEKRLRHNLKQRQKGKGDYGICNNDCLNCIYADCKLPIDNEDK